MGSPLRKSIAANDSAPKPPMRPLLSPLLSPLPLQAPPAPRVVPYVRLAPVAPRREVSLAAICAVLLLAATIFILGMVAGVVLWFTYDVAMPEHAEQPIMMPVAIAPPVEMKQQNALVSPATETPSLPLEHPAPADIVLPAIEPPSGDASPMLSPLPQSGSLAANNDMQLVIHDRGAADADDLMAGAREQMAMDKNSVALALFERVLAADAGNHVALEGKAEALARLAVKPDAPPAMLTELRRIAASSADDPAIQAAFARALAQRGSTQEAITCLDRALRLNPGDIGMRFDLAVLYDRAGHGPEALALYGQILQLGEDENSPLAASVLDSVRRRAAWLAAAQLKAP